MLSAGADRLKKVAGDGYSSALAVRVRDLLSTGHEDEVQSNDEYTLLDPMVLPACLPGNCARVIRMITAIKY